MSDYWTCLSCLSGEHYCRVYNPTGTLLYPQMIQCRCWATSPIHCAPQPALASPKEN